MTLYVKRHFWNRNEKTNGKAKPGSSAAKRAVHSDCESGPWKSGKGWRQANFVACAKDRGRLVERKEIPEMRDQKRSMRPHEKGLAALYAFLISVITQRAIRRAGWFKQRKSKWAIAWHGPESRFIAPVEFIAENGGGPGARLKKARRAATKSKKGD
jgi:hypothetical protein